MALSDTELLLYKLQETETWVRLCIVCSFGLSFFLNGFVLQGGGRSPRSLTTLFRVGRFCYLFGTGFLIAFCTLAVISPTVSLSALVMAGISLVISLITLGLDRDNPGVPALHFLSGAVVFLVMAANSFLFDAATQVRVSMSWLVALHVTTAVAGEGLFAVAFCGSLLYVWDYSRLKNKIIEHKPFLPSLDTLDRIVEKTSLAGLFLITTSLISGLTLVFGTGNAEASFTKIIWAFAVWTWFVLAIFGREFLGWRGRRGAQLTIWGTVLLLAALFGTVWKRA